MGSRSRLDGPDGESEQVACHYTHLHLLLAKRF